MAKTSLLLSGKMINLINDVDIIDHDYRKKKEKPGWPLPEVLPKIFNVRKIN